MREDDLKYLLQLVQYNELARANKKVRFTPHVTINILYCNQLLAAAKCEKGPGKKKPKANSVYVTNAVRLSFLPRLIQQK